MVSVCVRSHWVLLHQIFNLLRRTGFVQTPINNYHDYNDTTKYTVAGGCPFSDYHGNAQIYYVTLPKDTSELNSFMCSSLNRTGLLCSQCQRGLGPAVLSYKWQCVECFDRSRWKQRCAAHMHTAQCAAVVVGIYCQDLGHTFITHFTY